MHAEAITCIEDFEALHTEWNDLVAESLYPCIFLTHDWFLEWWRAYGTGKRPFVLLTRTSGQMNAALPLYALASGARDSDHLHSWTNDQSPRFDFMIRRGADPDSVTEALLRRLRAEPDWSCCEIHEVPSASPASRKARARALREGFSVHTAAGMESPYLLADEPWNVYVERRSSDFRRKLRRSRAKIGERGRLEVREYSSPSEADQFLRDMAEIEVRTWKHREGSSILSSEEHHAFYRGFVRRAAQQGWLHGYILYVGDEAAAYDLCFLYQDRLYSTKIGYREDMQNLGLGQVLHAHILELVFDRRVPRFDFLGKSDPHKLQWTQTMESLVHLRLFAPRWSSRLRYLASWRIPDWLRSQPALRSLRDRLRGREGAR